MSHEKTIPQAIETESAVLGLILRDGWASCAAFQAVMPDLFCLDSHRRIFSAISGLVEDGGMVDIVTVGEALRDRRELDAIGGFAYLSSLTSLAAMKTMIPRHLATLEAKARLRKILAETERATLRALEGDPAEEIAQDLREALELSPESSAELFIPGHAFINQAHKEIAWRVERILEVGTNGLIQAHPGAGKSFLTCLLAICLAAGERFFGMKVSTCSVALVSREDYPGTTASRLRRIMVGMGLNPDWTHLGESLWVNSRLQSPKLALDNPRELAQLIQNLKSRQIEFLILDVLNVLHGADENDNTEMRKVFKRIEQIRDEVGCQIAVVHHTKKNLEDNALLKESGRGAGAIGGFAEFIIGVKLVDEDAEIRQMRFFTKASQAYPKFHWQIRDEGPGVILERIEWEQPAGSRSRVSRALGR